jgi:hypothetical protein
MHQAHSIPIRNGKPGVQQQPHQNDVVGQNVVWTGAGELQELQVTKRKAEWDLPASLLPAVMYLC